MQNTPSRSFEAVGRFCDVSSFETSLLGIGDGSIGMDCSVQPLRHNGGLFLISTTDVPVGSASNSFPSVLLS